MSPVVEARVVELRRVHPTWGADRIAYQLGKEGLHGAGADEHLSGAGS